MRQLLFLFIVLTIIPSCDQRKQESPQQEVPKALEEPKQSYSLVSKRGYDDLVESIYGELVDKTPELKKLEEDMDAIADSKDDSLQTFTEFDSKNQRYYSSAKNHGAQIKDSLLREKMKKIIELSLSNYTYMVAPHNNLIQSIEAKESRLSDVHIALKIIKTLPVISKYQKNSVPSTKPLEGLSQKMERTINKAEKLSEQ